jgi:hypothetical protein
METTNRFSPSSSVDDSSDGTEMRGDSDDDDDEPRRSPSPFEVRSQRDGDLCEYG